MQKLRKSVASFRTLNLRDEPAIVGRTWKRTLMDHVLTEQLTGHPLEDLGKLFFASDMSLRIRRTPAPALPLASSAAHPARHVLGYTAEKEHHQLAWGGD